MRVSPRITSKRNYFEGGTIGAILFNTPGAFASNSLLKAIKIPCFSGHMVLLTCKFVLICFGSRTHMAPVAGSTINHPINPPKTRFPAIYQPLGLASSITSQSLHPSFSRRILYLAPRKKPALAFNGIIYGVIPDPISESDLASMIFTLAPVGFDLMLID